jgi:hypothetical protein
LWIDLDFRANCTLLIYRFPFSIQTNYTCIGLWKTFAQAFQRQQHADTRTLDNRPQTILGVLDIQRQISATGFQHSQHGYHQLRRMRHENANH